VLAAAQKLCAGAQELFGRCVKLVLSAVEPNQAWPMTQTV
jgi:hypothetical protein